MNKIRLYLLLALPFVSCKSAEIKLGKELLPLEQTKTIVTLDEYIEEIGYIRPDTTRFLYSKKILTRKNGDLITGDRDGNSNVFWQGMEKDIRSISILQIWPYQKIRIICLFWI